VWHVNADVRGRHYCPGCDSECVGQGGCNGWPGWIDKDNS
jgi:hypothetical protein